MTPNEITSREAVLCAVEEFDDIGREKFLSRYGFGPARSNFLVHRGRRYDFKAIFGVAYGHQFPDRGPLKAREFRGDSAMVHSNLVGLGFEITGRRKSNITSATRSIRLNSVTSPDKATTLPKSNSSLSLDSSARPLRKLGSINPATDIKLLENHRQRLHFETIHDCYENQYYDHWSMKYRETFIYPFIWKGMDLNGLKVAELASGTGHNSKALMDQFPEIELAGFDICRSACAGYLRNVGFPAYEADLTAPIHIDEQFDLAFVIGGLHHCVSNLEQTISNVAKLLKPGGQFVMLEPSSEFILEPIRKIWYKFDSSFDQETEHALNHDVLLNMGRQYFEGVEVKYFGGPAYFSVLNSMILKIPTWLKPIISPPLMWMERAWNLIPGRNAHNVFLARWQRIGRS